MREHADLAPSWRSLIDDVCVALCGSHSAALRLTSLRLYSRGHEWRSPHFERSIVPRPGTETQRVAEGDGAGDGEGKGGGEEEDIAVCR